ncbi:hypothetical protein GGP81_001875 [Salinibacter ruber]|uniref:hypothetical protein n=1 Tax=Salinibacter ruber TaxID=146919 RepID=UPI0021698ED8|nr:hypothetical protein [Salinibacter ruber]MCS3955350.1 hypothetical protein [Salinibacter ruber]
MELQSFDLLWLSDPIERCPRDDTPLNIHDAPLDVEGPHAERYVTEMARCPSCGRWHGLLPVLYEIMDDFGWDASDISGFAVDDEAVTAGVDLQGATIPWATFGEQTQAMREASSQPPPSEEEFRALDQVPATWEVRQASATWIEDESGAVDLGYVAVVHGPAVARSTDIRAGNPFDARQLSELIRRAGATPHPPAEAGRPRQVRVGDDSLAEALRSRLAPMGVEVQVGETSLADEALAEITAMLLGHSAPPVFQDVDDAAVRAFTESAARFYDDEPWVRTEGDRFLGVQVGDGDWFFANVMGQMEESPGLSLFDDWMTVCRFVHNQPSPFFALAEELGLGDESGFLEEMAAFAHTGPFEAAGALEGLTLSERTDLHPVDARRLDQLSVGPAAWGQYAVPRRFDIDEGLVPPHFSLETYRLVIEALLLALERRRATPVTSIKTTLDISGRSVSLRYPADGTERPYDGPEGYRFFLRGHDDDMESPSRIPDGERIEIEAPATALYKDVAKALTTFDDRIYEASLYEWKTCLWNDRASRRNPSPRIADLAELRDPTDLGIEIGGCDFALVLDEALDTAPEEIRLRWASRE